MLKRRTFLQYMVAAPCALWISSHTLAETEFERFKREQSQDFKGFQDQWLAHKADYNQAFQAYRQRLAMVWSNPEISSQSTWVDYDKSLQTRRAVDFARNEVRLSFTGSDLANLTEARIRAEFEKTLKTTVGQAYANDPVLSNSSGKSAPNNRNTVAGVNGANINSLLATAKRSEIQTPKGEVLTLTIPLPPSSVPERAKGYLSLVQQNAIRWQIDPALILAVMQAESQFNPLARSHIPAFGLMQIVPGSAGLDATKRAWGKETLLSGSQLFNPSVNIELGSAYLNLLDKEYLSPIKHPQSRLYCVIAAYNTGAGNVARSFVGNFSVLEAARRINAMTPAQVFAHLQRHLPYGETRSYLVKVTDALKTYSTT